MRAIIDSRRYFTGKSRSPAGEGARRLFSAPRRSAATALLLAALAGPAFGQGAPASSANEIRIGNTVPYTGPASAYGVIGKVLAAYFDKVNAEGGINGRKITFISYDDAYNPTKTMELTRKLVEEDNVLFILASLGTNTSQAVHPYMNAKKVPQLFVASGATMWDQPREFPWTMGFLPSYQTEAHIYSHYILENYPRGKIAVLYQDDGFGKDYLKGLKDGLGGKVPIVAEAPYKVTDASIDAQIAKLKASGADIFMQFTTPKFATMAIKRNAEIGWKPVHFLASVSESVSSVMAPAGIEISMIGSINAVCTSATLSADDVICVIAQAAPTPWIRRPRLETRLAIQIRRNSACRNGAAKPSPENIERFGASGIARSVCTGRGRP